MKALFKVSKGKETQESHNKIFHNSKKIVDNKINNQKMRNMTIKINKNLKQKMMMIQATLWAI